MHEIAQPKFKIIRWRERRHHDARQCVSRRAVLLSCRTHAFRQHRIASSSPIVAAIDACAHPWTTPTRVTNFAHIIRDITRGIERSRARPSRE